MTVVDRSPGGRTWAERLAHADTTTGTATVGAAGAIGVALAVVQLQVVLVVAVVVMTATVALSVWASFVLPNTTNRTTEPRAVARWVWAACTTTVAVCGWAALSPVLVLLVLLLLGAAALPWSVYLVGRRRAITR